MKRGGVLAGIVLVLFILLSLVARLFVPSADEDEGRWWDDS